MIKTFKSLFYVNDGIRGRYDLDTRMASSLVCHCSVVYGLRAEVITRDEWGGDVSEIPGAGDG
jgi:hypothetical protein